jgi:hypothetical protein
MDCTAITIVTQLPPMLFTASLKLFCLETRETKATVGTVGTFTFKNIPNPAMGRHLQISEK